ncbi:hypothetical protein [Bdellovibrio sp. HCB337]|uniref:hypothetical protein n=1 Tax=Bdellovibrio sp. HCB337 TaxID=3394358 RepID=UPI0039A6A1F7
MKKLIYFIQLIFIFSLFAGQAVADTAKWPMETLVKIDRLKSDEKLLVYQAKEVSQVGPELWDRLQVQFTNGKAVVTYSYSKDSLTNEIETTRDLVFLEWLRERIDAPENGPALIESLYNATRKSSVGRWAILHSMLKGGYIVDFKLLVKMALAHRALTAEQVEAFRAPIEKYFESETTKYETLSQKDLSERAKSWEAWKKQTGTLDALDKAQVKLDDYVRNSDRTGARKLIEAYLPWPVMDPFEAMLWKSWLSAMEQKPSPANTVLLYRGVSYDTDVPFRAANGTPGFMSTLLTRNQGSYNRRLRSYATRRLVNGGLEPESKNLQASLLSNQMTAHAAEPRGSAFLSFTPKFRVAASFAAPFNTDKGRIGGALMVVRVNPARAITNGPASADYVDEKEVLLPLLVFPDEVVYYLERKSEKFLVDPEEFLPSLEKVLSKEEYQKATENVEDFNGKGEMVTEFYKHLEQAVKTP